MSVTSTQDDLTNFLGQNGLSRGVIAWSCMGLQRKDKSCLVRHNEIKSTQAALGSSLLPISPLPALPYICCSWTCVCRVHKSHSPGNPCNDISGVHENLGWSWAINKQKESNSQNAESYSFLKNFYQTRSWNCCPNAHLLSTTRCTLCQKPLVLLTELQVAGNAGHHMSSIQALPRAAFL